MLPRWRMLLLPFAAVLLAFARHDEAEAGKVLEIAGKGLANPQAEPREAHMARFAFCCVQECAADALSLPVRACRHPGEVEAGVFLLAEQTADEHVIFLRNQHEALALAPRNVVHGFAKHAGGRTQVLECGMNQSQEFVQPVGGRPASD